MVKSQTEKNREQRAKMTDEQRKAFNMRLRYNSSKSFIIRHATKKQLKELQQIINDRLKPWSTINTKREPRH